MRSDSVASYGATRTVEFVGHVVYTDSGSMVMRADRGIYYRDGDRWEARGNVTTQEPEDRVDDERAVAGLLPRRPAGSVTPPRSTRSPGRPSGT